MKLKEYLKLKELTQFEFAQRVGISHKVINNIVNNKRKVGKKLAIKISQATNNEVSVMELLFQDEEV